MTEMTEQFIARQGDVLVMAVAAADGKVMPRDDQGRIVLAYGEVTGHAHAIYDDGAELLAPRSKTKAAIDHVDGDVIYLRCRKTVALRHEEHAPINIPAGLYRVVRQREYTPEEIRRVAD